MATRTRKQKTADELRDDYEKAKQRVASLQERVYAKELDEAISKTNISADLKAIKKRFTDIPIAVILKAAARSAGYVRINVTQDEAKPRAKKTVKK